MYEAFEGLYSELQLYNKRGAAAYEDPGNHL